jgi:hypothetical protein
MRMCAECEEGCEASDGGCVRGTGSTHHDDGNDVYLCTWPLASEGVGKRGVCISDKLRGLRGYSMCNIIHSPIEYVLSRSNDVGRSSDQRIWVRGGG